MGSFTFAWWFGSIDSTPTMLAFLAVGQGDCSVLLSGGHAVLIDAGPETPFTDAGAAVIVPWLKAHGVDQIDGIFLSHPDQDHVGGTGAVLGAYPGTPLFVSDQFHGDRAMLSHLARWSYPQDRVHWLPRFASIKVGEVTGFIDCPDKPAGAGANDGSMFMRLTVGAGTATFTGDAPRKVEQRCEADGTWASEILHIGHHGSKTASDPGWLKCVHPRFALISVGRANHYGFPNPAVLKELQEDGITVLRTDLEGTICFRFDGQEFSRVVEQ